MRSAARWLAPALDALRSGREPTSPERRRLVLVGGAVAGRRRMARRRAARRPRARRRRAVARARRAACAPRSAGATRSRRRRRRSHARSPTRSRAGTRCAARSAAAARGGGVRGPAGEELRVGGGGARARRAHRRRAARVRPACRPRSRATRSPRPSCCSATPAATSPACCARSPRRSRRAGGSSRRPARRPRRRASRRLLVTGCRSPASRSASSSQPGYLASLAASPLTRRAGRGRARPAGRGVRLRAADRARGGADVTALLAGLGGICAAAAIVELLAAPRPAGACRARARRRHLWR